MTQSERRYLSPEPLLQNPNWVRAEASEGFISPTYSYARNNPVRYTDSTGLYAQGVICASPNAGMSGSLGFQVPNSDPCLDCKVAQDLRKAICEEPNKYHPLLPRQFVPVMNGKPRYYWPADCECAKLLEAEVCKGVSPGLCPKEKSGGKLACAQ